jgi:hypothetical protein
MADVSVNHARQAARFRGHRPDRLEYRIYFALIFALALVFALAGWAVDALRGQRGRPGPVARAIAEARQIAPLIFRG